MTDLGQLEKRIDKLEHTGAVRFSIQYLLSPILVLALGSYFNLRLENTKSKIERVGIAHEMINTALSGDYEKSFITLWLVDVVLDPELAAQIKDGVIGYYEKKLATSLEEGRPEEAVKIIRAARGVNRETAQELEERIPKTEKDGRTESALKNAEQADMLTTQGFQFLASRRYEEALASFRRVEEVYPEYGTAYEIIRLLEENINQMNDPHVEQRVLRTISEQYSWKAPLNLRIQQR
jgi:tetratricopeptide (TPR) repeat protein